MHSDICSTQEAFSDVKRLKELTSDNENRKLYIPPGHTCLRVVMRSHLYEPDQCASST